MAHSSISREMSSLLEAEKLDGQIRQMLKS